MEFLLRNVRWGLCSVEDAVFDGWLRINKLYAFAHIEHLAPLQDAILLGFLNLERVQKNSVAFNGEVSGL